MSGNFTIKVVGIEKLKAKTTDLSAKFIKSTAKAVNRFANRVRTDAVKAVQRGPKTGHVYGDHQASAPGEPPATDTGNLANNIKVFTEPEKATAYVKAQTAYAARLEFGDTIKDPKKPFIEARPFLLPALENNRPGFVEEFREAWREAREG